MDPFSVLESLGEIGIAITGFAGLVAVVGRRSADGWTDEDRANLRSLLLWSLGAVFLAFVPLVLASFGGALADPWRLANAIFAAFHAWVFFEVIRGIRARGVPVTPFARGLFAVGFGVLGCEVLAAAGPFAAVAASIYLVAVLWFLFLAVTRFVAIVGDELSVPRAR